MADRQSIVQALVEGALRAAADPSVTMVYRDWDYFGPGATAQPLAPSLVVGVSDDIPYGVGIDLYRCTVMVGIVVPESSGIRDDFDRIRESVRSVMASVQHLSAYGVTISGCLEQSCTEPDQITQKGDILFAQTVAFRLWFEAPPAPPAILDPVPYLVERDPETGTVYATCQAQDPRRIDRWTMSGATVMLSHGYGAWADKASLEYSAPVQPLSTELSPAAPAADQTVTP